MGQGDSLSQECILCIEVYRDRQWLEVSQQIAVPWRGTSWVPFELFCMYACMGSRFSHVWLFATLWTVAQQAILSMGSPGKNREWVTLPSFKGSSRSRDRTLVTCTASRFLTTEPQGKPIQFSSVTQCVRLCNPMNCSTQHSQSLPKLMSIESVMPSNHLILSSPSFPVLNISQHQGLFRWVSSLHWGQKYWSFNFNITPSNEHPGLLSFRMDWLDLLAVQGTLKSLLQHHSSKASILRLSAFFIVQLSRPYMTTGKTIALTRWTFVGKVISLLFNMLSRLVITFLPRSKRLLISWLQSPSAVILEPRKIKSATVSTVSPSICHEVMGPDAMILVFWMSSSKPTFSLSSFTFILGTKCLTH